MEGGEGVGFTFSFLGDLGSHGQPLGPLGIKHMCADRALPVFTSIGNYGSKR